MIRGFALGLPGSDIIFTTMLKPGLLPALALCPLLWAQPTLQVTSALGTKFYSLPDDKGVVAAALKTLAADPGNPDLLLKLAQAQVSVWQDREAVETLSRAIALAPANAALYTERGHRELPLREFAKARADLQKATQLDPKKMDAFYHLGLAHYFLGEFAPAATAFRHAVDLAPDTDERINSTNWLYATLRRANQFKQAADVLLVITPETKNTAEHTEFYLNLVRFFQGRMTEARALPPEPAVGSTDTEAELRFDTVAYGVGNWHLYNRQPAKAKQYFQRIVKGRVWITWGFVGAEVELTR
jgi:tetratricopeptide (TPR) repeat protein